MVLKLFTQPTCPKCPPAKKLISNLKSQITLAGQTNVKVEEYDVTTIDGLTEASFYTVMSTPGILLCDDEGKELVGWRGEVPSEKELLSKIG